MYPGLSSARDFGYKTASVKALAEIWHFVLFRVSQFWDARRNHRKCEKCTNTTEPLPVGDLTFSSTAQARHIAGQRLELHFYCSSVKESAWLEILKSPALTYLSEQVPEQLLTDHIVRTSSCFGNGVWTSTAGLGFTASLAVTGSTKTERNRKAEIDCSFQKGWEQRLHIARLQVFVSADMQLSLFWGPLTPFSPTGHFHTHHPLEGLERAHCVEEEFDLQKERKKNKWRSIQGYGLALGQPWSWEINNSRH